MRNSESIPTRPSGAPEPASLPAEAITLNTGDAAVTKTAAPHSLLELRAEIAAGTTHENARITRLRELDRFGSHLKDNITDIAQITSEHVDRWWTGMGKFSVASGQDRLKALVAVFGIAKELGWITGNPARDFRDAQKVSRKLAASQGETAPADGAEPAKVDAATATVAPPPSTSDKEEQRKSVPPFQVEAPLPAGPAATDPAQAALAAAEAKKRARVAKKRALMTERLKLTPLARCAACENLKHGCEFGFPARWEVPDQDEGDCLVTGLSRSTLRDLTDSQDGALPEVKAYSDKGKRIILGKPWCERMRKKEIKGKAPS